MRNKTLLALGICLLLYLPTQAQTDTTAPKRYKWEVATDLLWLINKNNIPINSIFVRRHFVTKKGKNVALRMRLGWGFDYKKNTTYNLDPKIDSIALTNISYEDKTQTIAPFLIVGYQESKVYGKYELFYGIDIRFEYFKGQYSTILGVPPNPSGIPPNPIGQYRTIGINNINSVTLGINPLVGLKYYLNKRFSISGEAALTLLFSKENSKRSLRNYPMALPDPSNRWPKGETDSYRFNINILPFYVLNLSYNF